jgi:ribosomal protein L12E/L44/L45/RPP1/RPP2
MAAKKKKEKEKSAFESLAPKHQLFVKQYIICNGKGGPAYREVYGVKDMNTAYVNANKLLRNTKIKQAVDDEYKKIFKEKDSEIEKSKTYKLIRMISDADIDEVTDLENGTLKVKNMSEIPRSAIPAIQSIKRHRKETAYGTDDMLEIKMHDKLKAIELRAKFQGLLEKDVLGSVEIIVKPAVRPDKSKEE